jgi:hypothetical protein
LPPRAGGHLGSDSLSHVDGLRFRIFRGRRRKADVGERFRFRVGGSIYKYNV